MSKLGAWEPGPDGELRYVYRDRILARVRRSKIHPYEWTIHWWDGVKFDAQKMPGDGTQWLMQAAALSWVRAQLNVELNCLNAAIRALEEMRSVTSCTAPG